MDFQPGYLSKREQQIMEVVYAREEVTAAELCEVLPGQPSNATVRKLLRILEERGQLSHREEGGRYVYRSVTPRQSAARQAMSRLVQTFFRGSVGEAVAAFIKEADQELTPQELERLERLIEEAKAKQ